MGIRVNKAIGYGVRNLKPDEVRRLKNAVYFRKTRSRTSSPRRRRSSGRRS